ncbi:uncharacterized protein METZ01_LOCUS296725, partial [marine metagenome]
PNTSFLAPFPDYKLPTSIVTESGFEQNGFDAAAFAWQSVKQDLQLPDILGFAPELVWPQIFSNELGLELSNSFLVAASATTNKLLESSILTYHYSSNRVAQYAKETIFVRDNSKRIAVNYRMLYQSERRKDNEGVIKFNFPTTTPYTYGHLLSLEFIQIVSLDDWSIDEVGGFLCRYTDVLQKLLGEEQVSAKLSKTRDKLPGKYFDIIPQNIVIREDGSVTVIDQEWELPDDIDLGMCLFRSMLLLMSIVTRFGKNKQGVTYSRYQFIQDAFQAAGFVFSRSDIDQYFELETLAQSQITGYPVEHFHSWSPEVLLPTENLTSVLLSRTKEIKNLQVAEAATRYAAKEHFDVAQERLNVITMHLDVIRQKEDVIQQKELDIVALRQSSS